MKKILFVICFFTLGLVSLQAQEIDIMNSQVKVNNLNVKQEGASLLVGMNIDVSKLKVKRGSEVILTPTLKDKEVSQELPQVRIMGRRRYLYNLRNHVVEKGDKYTYRAKTIDNIDYRESTSYSEWMDNSTLYMTEDVCGCCGEELANNLEALIQREAFVPDFVFVKPKVEKKTRALEGTAFIDFPVNKTVIEPTYRNNKTELSKIDETINSVKSDADFTINGIALKGYASPEGSYKHNEELSIGRVNALKDYVQKLHSFSSSDITTENEPENWEGLKKYVEASDLEHKAEILEMIDSDLEPDAKEAKIKATYPGEYKYLLDNCYPALRRTDYKVNYTIREFSDIEEIKNMYNTNPSKLSPAELYQLAETYGTGSDDYYDILKKTYELNPSDAVSSINAANLAMKNEDLELAEKCLSTAGDTGEAAYARGVLSAMEENYAEAADYFQKAKDAGFEKANENLEFVNGLLR